MVDIFIVSFSIHDTVRWCSDPIKELTFLQAVMPVIDSAIYISMCCHPCGRTAAPCQRLFHYTDVIMSAMTSQITSVSTVYTTIFSGTDQRNHQNSASLAFVRGIHRWPVNSPHKEPVTRKMFPFDDIIMSIYAHMYTDDDVITISFFSLLTFCERNPCTGHRWISPYRGPATRALVLPLILA